MSNHVPAATSIADPAVAERRAVLSISPFPEDHIFLRRAVPAATFTTADSCRAACSVLCRARMDLIICEHQFPGGDWKDILGYTVQLPNPPRLIVTSAAPDDRLWAEVLNLGGYDVLVKPFAADEVSLVTAYALGLVNKQLDGSYGKTYFEEQTPDGDRRPRTRCASGSHSGL